MKMCFDMTVDGVNGLLVLHCLYNGINRLRSGIEKGTQSQERKECSEALFI